MADRPPGTKMPLYARKNLRDEYELKSADLLAYIKDILGVEWFFDIHPLAIYAYAEENSFSQNLGSCITSYIESFIYSLKELIERDGQQFVDEINSVVPTHTITMGASTDVGPFCGSRIMEGKLALLFTPHYLGEFSSDVAKNLEEIINTAPQPAGASSLSYQARRSVRIDYIEKVTPLLEKAQELLEVENHNFKFEPDFEAVGAKLKSSNKDHWEYDIGRVTLEYFASFVRYMEYNKFGEEEMFREATAEAAPKAILRLRIVEQLQKDQNPYNEIVLDDGELVIQTTAANFGIDASVSCAKIIDIL